MRHKLARILARADYALALRVARLGAPYSARARFAKGALENAPKTALLDVGAAFWGDVLMGRRPNVRAYLDAALALVEA